MAKPKKKRKPPAAREKTAPLPHTQQAVADETGNPDHAPSGPRPSSQRPTTAKKKRDTSRAPKRPRSGTVPVLLSCNGGAPPVDTSARDDTHPPLLVTSHSDSLAAQCASLVEAVRRSPAPGVTPRELEHLSCTQATTRLLDLMSQTPRDTLRSEAHGGVDTRCAVTIVTRAWEESFMREASGTERPCMHADSCTCFASLIPKDGVRDPTFALAEFYTEVSRPTALCRLLRPALCGFHVCDHRKSMPRFGRAAGFSRPSGECASSVAATMYIADS